MRLTNSTLKTNLQVELTDSRSRPPDAIVEDRRAILWVINWPARGLVQDYVQNLMDYTTRHLQIADTYLIFDRYYENSIKEATRTSRAGKNASRHHQLSMLTPLPPQKVVLTVTQNKLQLIKLICAFLRERQDSYHTVEGYLWLLDLNQHPQRFVMGVCGRDQFFVQHMRKQM